MFSNCNVCDTSNLFFMCQTEIEKLDRASVTS